MSDATASIPATGRPAVSFRIAFLAANLVLFAIALVPVFATDVLPLVDYPNHLARMHILGAIEGSPGLQQIYSVVWSAVPNLAMDVAVPGLAKLLGVTRAAQLFVALSMAMLVAGVTFLHYAFHKRLGWAPLAAYLCLYDYSLGYGFINYYFGIGLALIALALWHRSEAWPFGRRAVVFAALATGLYFSHLIALAAYGIALAGYEAWRLRSGSDRLDPAWLVRRAAPIVLQFLPAVVLLLAAALPRQEWDDFLYRWPMKAQALFAPFLLFHQIADYAAFILLMVLALWLRARGGLHFARPLLFPVAALAVAVLLFPTGLGGSWFNDVRLGTAIWPIALAAITVEGASRRTVRWIAAAAAVLFLVRTADLTQDFAAYGRMYDELRAAAIVAVEPGSRVLPAMQNVDNIDAVAPTAYRRVFDNAAALLVLDQPVFVPNLFTAKGRQPLAVDAPYSDVAVPYGPPMPEQLLIAGVSGDNAARMQALAGTGTWHRWAGWPSSFDYVVMLDFGAPRNPLPDILAPRWHGSFFTIYAVNAAGRSEP